MSLSASVINFVGVPAEHVDAVGARYPYRSLTFVSLDTRDFDLSWSPILITFFRPFVISSDEIIMDFMIFEVILHLDCQHFVGSQNQRGVLHWKRFQRSWRFYSNLLNCKEPRAPYGAQRFITVLKKPLFGPEPNPEPYNSSLHAHARAYTHISGNWLHILSHVQGPE